MPLGISESLIQRAYAPVDLSGFYKGIDEASKLAAAEERAEKKALQKEYYNSVAVLSKDMNGIKSQDMPEVNGHYTKWKSAQQKLMQTSFDRNPEEYAKLNAEANAEYGLTMSTIGLSKQKKKEHEAVYNNMLNNPVKYKKDAIKQWQNVMLMPTSEAVKLNNNGISNDDISQLQYTGPTVAQQVGYEKELSGKDIYSNAKVVTYGDNKKGYYAGYDVEVPDINLIQNKARTYLSVYGAGEQDKFAQSYIDNNKNNVIEVKKQWDALPDSYFEKYKAADNVQDKYPLHISPITGKQTRKPDLFTTDTAAENFISYSTAKSLLSNPEKSGKQFSQYAKGDQGKAEFNNDLATQKSLTMAAVQNEYALARQQKGFDFRLEELPAMQKLLMVEKNINTLNGKVGEGELATWVAANPNADPTAKLEEIKQRGLDIVSGKKTKTTPITPSFGQYVPSAIPSRKEPKAGEKSKTRKNPLNAR